MNDKVKIHLARMYEFDEETYIKYKFNEPI